MSETFYTHLIKVDEFGERLTMKSEKLGRIMSKEALPTDEEEEEVEEEEADTKTPKEPIPLELMTKVFYF